MDTAYRNQRKYAMEKYQNAQETRKKRPVYVKNNYS
jgi:hypothetical protein